MRYSGIIAFILVPAGMKDDEVTIQRIVEKSQSRPCRAGKGSIEDRVANDYQALAAP